MPANHLLDTIYSTAFDIDGWQKVCDEFSKHANAVGSVLICGKPELRPFNYSHSDSFDGLMDEYVQDGWYLRDARSSRVLTQGLSGNFFSQGYVLDRQLMPPDEMRREPFYAELLASHNLKWMCGLRIGDVSDWVALVINRSLHQDDFEPAEIRSLLHYGRHLTRAAEIAEMANFTKLDAALQVFETTATPAFALDATGVVRRHNAAAEDMLGHGLSLSGGRLVCDLGDDQARLDRLINQLPVVVPSQRPADPVVVRRRDGIAAFVFRGCPLVGPPIDIFGGPTSILFVQSLQPAQKDITTLLQQSFGLSPTQARLTEILAHGHSLKTAADRMQITYGTARDHLKVVFSKTGTNRQGQLVALISSLLY